MFLNSGSSGVAVRIKVRCGFQCSYFLFREVREVLVEVLDGSGGGEVLRVPDFGAGSGHRDMQSYFKAKFPPVVCFHDP